MDLFDKSMKVVKEVGDSVVSTTKKVSDSLKNVTREQSELAGVKIQKSNIEKKLTQSYAKIGKKYVEYMKNTNTDETFDVSDILEAMQPDLDKIVEIEVSIAQTEEQIKKDNAEREMKKAQAAFDSEKAKLDKALEIDIITEDEYAAKLAVAQKKLDNYEVLRKINLQLEMGIITKAEYEEKVKNILG